MMLELVKVKRSTAKKAEMVNQLHHFCLNSFKHSNQRMLTDPAAKHSARSLGCRVEK